MGVITETLIMFAFIYMIFAYKILDDNDDNLVKNKIILFISLYCFYFTLNILDKIYSKCKIDIKYISSRAIQIAIYGVLGYVLYNDLAIMDYTKNIVGNISDLMSDEDTLSAKMLYNKNIMITMIIILFISMIRIIERLFVGHMNECISY